MCEERGSVCVRRGVVCVCVCEERGVVCVSVSQRSIFNTSMFKNASRLTEHCTSYASNS